MMQSASTVMEDWGYIASILLLSTGGAILYLKTRSLPALAMSILVLFYWIGRAALQVAQAELSKARQIPDPFAFAHSPWWYGVYAGHAMQFGGFALGCVAFVVFALQHPRR